MSWPLTPAGLDLWTRILTLPLGDRAEIMARLADDIGRQAVSGALGLEFMAVARLREEAPRASGDGTAQETEPAQAPRRADGRRRTTRLPRRDTAPAPAPAPHGPQQYPRLAVDRAIGRVE